MNGYPTDEELSSLIEALEKEELYVPAHLKGEILQRVKKESRPADAGRKRGQPVSLGIYTLKIAIGMAAAIMLVFFLPARNGSNISWAEEMQRQEEAYEPRERLSDKLREKRQNIENTVEQWLNQMEDGGNNNDN